MIANTCGEKAGEITGGPWQLCWLLASSMAKSAEFVTEAVSVNCDQFCCTSANNTLCFSSLFQAGSICLSFAGLGRLKLKLDFGVMTLEAIEAGCSCVSSFPGERKFFQLGSSFLVLNNANIGYGMMWTR